jgi:hypothetical protein
MRTDIYAGLLLLAGILLGAVAFILSIQVLSLQP